MTTRRLLDAFQLDNAGYAGCTLTLYVADANGAATTAKATVYDGLTGTGTLANPQDFDSAGKLAKPAYIDVPVVPLITGAHVASQTLGAVCAPGAWRGDWATATLYLPGDLVRDGANGTNLRNVYAVVNLHQSGTWAADAADPAKLGLAIDYVALANTVVPDADTATKGKLQVATTAEINAANAAKAMRPDQFAASKYNPVGRHAIPILAASLQPDTTTSGGGPLVSSTRSATNGVLYRTLDFDQTTAEFAGFMLPWPKSSDDGTITFRARWTAAGGSGGVVWGLQAIGFGDGDPIDTAYGTTVTVTDTKVATGDSHVTVESSAITIKNLAEGDLVCFRVFRSPADVNDTMTADAQLLALDLFLTTNTGTDA